LENLLRDTVNETIKGKKYPEKFNIWGRALLSIPYAIPIVGNIAQSMLEYNSGFSVPATRVVEEFISGSKDLINPAGENEETKIKNKKRGAMKIAETLASVKGVAGISQAMDILERILIPPNETKDVVGTSIRPSLPSRPSREGRPSRQSR